LLKTLIGMADMIDSVNLFTQNQESATEMQGLFAVEKDDQAAVNLSEHLPRTFDDSQLDLSEVYQKLLTEFENYKELLHVDYQESSSSLNSQLPKIED
jgi:ribosomal protein S18 acetylase RimI-like enzyme